MEAGRNGRFHPFNDLKAFCHDAEGAFLAQPQVHGVVSPVIGMPLNDDGIHVSLKRPADERGISGHHVGEKPVGLCRERAFSELEIEQIFRDDDSYQKGVVRIFVDGQAELRDMLVEHRMNGGIRPYRRTG